VEHTQVLLLALRAKCNERTVERYLAGHNVRPAVEAAIVSAAKTLKIKLPKNGRRS